MASSDGIPFDFLSARAAEKTKTTLSKEIFEDFQRFLITEEKNIEELSKSEVKRLYGEDYKHYRQQISPKQALPTFYKLFRVLFQQNIAHFDDDKVCLGPGESRPGRRRKERGKGMPPHARFNPANTLGGQAPSSGRVIVDKPKMAVDQHLTFKPGTVKVTDLPDFRGDIELWKYISKSKSQSTNIYFCAVCQSKCNSSIDMEQHVNGRRHRLANSLSILKSKK